MKWNLLGACALLACTAAQAQGINTTAPITMLVGYTAGGSTDAATRVIAAEFSKQLRQTVVVENRPGASGMLATGVLARAKPNGLTLMMAASPTITMTPHVQSRSAANPLDKVIPLAMTVEYANVLIVNPQLPVRSLREFVDYGRAHPGKLSYGSSGVGSSNHFAAALLGSRTGVDLMHVPYTSNAPALADVISGQTQFMFDIVNTAAPQIRAGKVRALALTSPERNDALPDVPGTTEAGFAGLDMTGWFGVFAPAQTPSAVMQRYQQALQAALTTPAVAERLRDAGYRVKLAPAQQFAARIQSDSAIWAKVAADAGIQPAP